jgi:hypothetical protein
VALRTKMPEIIPAGITFESFIALFVWVSFLFTGKNSGQSSI